MSPRLPRRGATSASERLERRTRRARIVRWRPVLLVLLAVLLVVGAVYLVGFSSVLAVRQVAVEGVSGPQQAAVRQAAAIPMGVPLAKVDLEAPGRRVTESPLYSSAQVARRWPSTIVVTVTPRTPVLALRRGEGYSLVDEHGVAYLATKAAPKGVPVATGKGEVDAQGLRAAISVMSALPTDLRGRVSAIQVESSTMVTFQLGSTKVLWGDESDPQLKVKVLSALLRGSPKSINVSAPRSPATT